MDFDEDRGGFGGRARHSRGRGDTLGDKEEPSSGIKDEPMQT